MTTYTTPNSLPILESTDKIAAPGDGLLEDINALALAASTAITNEGARAEGSAKSYADDKDTTNRSAWASADATNLASAKTYADTQDATNLASAKTYADSKDTSNRSAWSAADVTNLASAKAYADATFVPAWKPSTAYAAGKRVIAPNGDVVTAKVAFTSAATYSDANWYPSVQVTGTNLGTADLTTITTPGPYYQTSNANATLARGYPVATAGALLILPWGTNIIRLYYPYVPGSFYAQTVNGGVFGPWKAFPSAAGIRTLNTDLDTVMDPGPWFQQDKTSATSANHYPVESLEQGAGLNLNWSDTGAVNRVQFFFPGSFQRFHRRTVFAGVPRAWETYEPTDVIQAKIMSQVSATISSALPTDDWAHWGDSLTDDAVLGVDSWVAKLSALTGKQHYNGGWYGQKTGEIVARIGADPMLGTFPGGVIPVAGSTANFTPSFGRVAQNNKSTRQMPGTIAGRYGYFTSPFSGDLVFTPTDSVSTATTVTGVQKFIPDNPYSNRITTIWAGTNDMSLATTPEQLTSMVRASIDYLTPRVKRFMIFTLPQGSTRPVGGTLYQKCDAINAAYRSLAPGNVVEIAAYLMTDQAAVDAGITFTADDRTDIANGYTPRSFRLDDIHVNAAAGVAIAKKVYAEALARGWVA